MTLKPWLDMLSIFSIALIQESFNKSRFITNPTHKMCSPLVFQRESYISPSFSCDKYWHCQDGFADLKTCGNGLGFLDTDDTFTLEQVKNHI